MGTVVIILSLMCQFIFAQSNSVIIRGVVYCENKETGPLQNVNIYNPNQDWGTISDKLGQFEIKMMIGDTLYFSSIQHVEKKFYFDDSKTFEDQIIEIEMPQDTTWLEVVNVIGMPAYEKFKKELLELVDDGDFNLAFPIIEKYSIIEGKRTDMELKLPLT